MERRFELAATALLAIAAVATAWASCQSARWRGEQAKASGAAVGVRHVSSVIWMATSPSASLCDVT